MKLFTTDQTARFSLKCPYIVTVCEGRVQQLMIFKKCVMRYLFSVINSVTLQMVYFD
jgi:hypothetical protein